MNHGIAGHTFSMLRVHDVVTIISVHDVLNVVTYSVDSDKNVTSRRLINYRTNLMQPGTDCNVEERT